MKAFLWNAVRMLLVFVALYMIFRMQTYRQQGLRPYREVQVGR
jgi:hypothetical protein